MPRRPLLLCIRVSLIAAAIACMFGLPCRGLAEEPPPAKQFVEVKLWVIEVSQSKLRNLGFDWGLARAKSSGTDSRKIMDDQQFLGFITALEQNNLASMLARPTIATQSGRKATIELSPHLKVEVTPTVIDAEHIAFYYHVEVATDREAQPDNAGRRLISACSTELKSGVGQLLSETTIHSRTAKGEPSNTTLLVFAQATIVK
ncbi:MAG: hypothetical protein L0211_04355 [Planctomycetaceae bacterium]|nr:hypothetical protein [Planctomycetaceae bacterium]